MAKRASLSDILKTPAGKLNTHLAGAQPQKHTPALKPKAKKEPLSKQRLNTLLWAWCLEKGYKCEREYYFGKPRMWRADWVIHEMKVLIEYNGLVSEKSRHTTIKGYTGDMEKLNKAQELGWRVYQYTFRNYKSALLDLDNLHKIKMEEKKK